MRAGAYLLSMFRKKSRINLALQGGGTHGAFTWGVLDRVLEERSIEISWISATSAGAINAVALAAGLSAGSREAAREKLREIWEAIHRAGVPEFLRLNPLLFSMSRAPAFTAVAQLWSPYEFNPLGFDPLRRLLGNLIDFAAIRERAPVELLIAATEVASGQARLFRRHEISVEAVLASACLPMVHHAVEIDGVAYWDGGFSANPDLVTLAMESPVPDTLIVQLSPLKKEGTPTGAREIQAHMNRLTFNAPLIRDVEIIETAREAMRGSVRSRIGRLRPLAQHRFHLVEAAPYTAPLGDESKMKPDRALLTHLYEAGRHEMDRWLETHRQSIGRRSTVDLREHFEGVRTPRSERPSAERRRSDQSAEANGARASETGPIVAAAERNGRSEGPRPNGGTS